MLLILLGIYVLVWGVLFAGLSLYYARQRTGFGLLPIALMALTWPIFLPFVLLYVVFVLLYPMAHRLRGRGRAAPTPQDEWMALADREVDTSTLLDDWMAETGEAKLAELRAQAREHLHRDEAEDD
jgi:hypothetical protein